MNVIAFETQIRAPIQRAFDLARSVDLHICSAAGTGERAVGGVVTGLLEMGDEVTWRGRHFGLLQTLRVRMTAYSRPEYFCDSMVQGGFKRMDHHHSFTAHGDVTVMKDVFYYVLPFGMIGQIFDSVLLREYLKRFLGERNAVLKRVAESGEWRTFLVDT